MPLEAEYAIATRLADVAPATQAVRANLPDWLGDAERDAIELALVEALTNIIEHGYHGDGGHTVRLRVRERPQGLVIDLWDQGRPIPRGLLESADAATTFAFDPTDLAALPEGGMGLALIKTAFDEVRYGSHAGMNRLRLVRRI